MFFWDCLENKKKNFFFNLYFELPDKIWIKPFAETDVEI